MPNDIYPAWGESSAVIAPQLYNWAQLNYANQGGNIARRQDFDRQDIANQQNYFQQQRAIEAEDAQRQAQAEAQAERLALAHGESARRNYEFGQSMDLEKKRLAQQDAATKLKYSPDLAGIEAEHKSAVAKLFMGKGEGHGMTDDEIALLTGAPADLVAKTAEPFRLQFPDKAVEALNNQTALMRLKNPDKFDLEAQQGAVEGLKLRLPPALRDRVTYDHDSHEWTLLPPAAARVTLTNPFGDPVSATAQNAAKAVLGWQRATRSGAYNFAPGGTTPAPGAAAVPEITPPYGNMGGGYFPPTRPPVLAPPPAVAPQSPVAPSAPTAAAAVTQQPADFLPMHDPRGRLVKVPWDQIAKYRARGYYE